MKNIGFFCGFYILGLVGFASSASSFTTSSFEKDGRVFNIKELNKDMSLYSGTPREENFSTYKEKEENILWFAFEEEVALKYALGKRIRVFIVEILSGLKLLDMSDAHNINKIMELAQKKDKDNFHQYEGTFRVEDGVVKRISDLNEEGELDLELVKFLQKTFKDCDGYYFATEENFHDEICIWNKDSIPEEADIVGATQFSSFGSPQKPPKDMSMCPSAPKRRKIFD